MIPLDQIYQSQRKLHVINLMLIWRNLKTKKLVNENVGTLRIVILISSD